MSIPQLAYELGITEEQAVALYNAMTVNNLIDKFKQVAREEDLVPVAELEDVDWGKLVHKYRLRINDDTAPRELIISILKEAVKYGSTLQIRTL